MGSFFSRRSENELTGPVEYMYVNYGTNSVRFVATWAKITADDGLLKFPSNGTFDRTKLENLRDKLKLRKHKNKHFASLRFWRDECKRRNAESQIASLTDQNKKLLTQLEEIKNTTQSNKKSKRTTKLIHQN